MNFVSLSNIGQTRIATPVMLVGASCALISSFSASSGKLYGIAGVVIGLANIGSGVWYIKSPSHFSMASVGVGLIALIIWVMPDLLSGPSPGGMAVLGVLAFLGYALYAFWFANKLKKARQAIRKK